MNLSTLLKGYPTLPASFAETRIDGIYYRSQEVQPHGLFVAIRGLSADGHDFIDEAARKGAAAIIVERSDLPEQIRNAAVIPVHDSRRALSQISARFYRNPSRQLVLIGITGTNGKTTTAYLIETVLKKAGCNVGVIGTINCRFGGRTFPNPMTTPESLDLHRILSEMKHNGVTHVVMEVSSHAIDLNRIAHCEFNVGVFTNLTQDHLDYHQTMDTYWACKKSFFTTHLTMRAQTENPVAVINENDPRGKQLGEHISISKISTGYSSHNRIHPQKKEMALSGISGILQTPNGQLSFQSKLVGRFNLENLLNTVGVATALNIPLDTIQEGIESFNGVPGRLEAVPNHCGRFVFVDYAHTPDALQNVLTTLKDTPLSSGCSTKGRLICVFGCGGDRDPQKRPQMGKIAWEYSDLAIITSDNPRTESPARIIKHILQGIAPAGDGASSQEAVQQGTPGNGFLVEPDRKKAIQLAIQASLPGDTILIAGKGHEDYQIIGNRKTAFDDRVEARKALSALPPEPIQSQEAYL